MNVSVSKYPCHMYREEDYSLWYTLYGSVLDVDAEADDVLVLQL